MIVGWAGQYRKGRLAGDAHPVAPVRQLGEVVCAHEPDEADFREAGVERAQRVARVAGIQVALDIGGDDAPAGGVGFGGACSGEGEAFGKRRHGVGILQRVAWGHQEPDLVETQAF